MISAIRDNLSCGSGAAAMPARMPGDTVVVVTGATGYIAAFIVKLALDQGYRVRGTVRSLSNEEKLAHLRAMEGAEERLELVEANLTTPEAFPSVMEGAHILLHTATPIEIPDEEHMWKSKEEVYEKQIDPAVEGTKAIFRAAADAGVEKVVLTASVSAMFAQNPPPSELNADQWSDIEMMEGLLLSNPMMGYNMAKTKQEKAAREVAEELNLSLATICPFLVIGPRLTPNVNPTNAMVKGIAEGRGIVFQESAPGTIPDGFLGIVDVREVAEAHILAMKDPSATGRYLLQGHNVHYADVVRVLRESNEAYAELPETPIDAEDGERHAEKAAMGFDNGPTRALGVTEIPWEVTIREVANQTADEVSAAPRPGSKREAASSMMASIKDTVKSLVGATSKRNPDETTMVVTGATGYVAAFIIKQALERGFHVRGTVRSLSDEEKVAHLRELPGADERLELVEADLTKPESFPDAVSGAQVLLHTATPIDIPETEDTMFKSMKEAHERQIGPAVDGTKALMKAAAEAGVEKVVLTSSSAAMMAQNPPPEELNEDQWSDLEMMEGSVLQAPPMAYFLAKTLQEKAAREVAKELDMKLATICPFLVIGPRLTPKLNGSNGMLMGLAQGKGIALQPSAPGTIPDGFVGIVDVREVAEAHILAGETVGATGRYLLQGHNVHYEDVIRVMREAEEAYANLPETPIDSEDGARHVEKAPMGFNNRPTRKLGVREIPMEDTITEAARTSAPYLSA